MNPQEFFARRSVFRHAEFAAAAAAAGSAPKTIENTLRYHVRAGHLLHVRRGVYAVVPPGFSPETVPLDPLLVASRLEDDAVLAYHTALELHGVAYSVFQQFTYCTGAHTRPLSFRGQLYRPLPFPKALRDAEQELFAVTTVDRQGQDVRVTSLERTLVDALDRPGECGGWEEVWRSLESVPYFDLDLVTEYALLLGSVTLNAKVGFFLDHHREQLMVEDRHLEPLRRQVPKSPHYLTSPDRRPGRFVAGWNLVVPPEFLAGSWDEGEGEFGAGLGVAPGAGDGDDASGARAAAAGVPV